MSKNFECIKSKICITDSGVGGLSVLIEVVKKVDVDTVYYFGDGENLPYGNKSKRELESVLFNNLLYIDSFSVDAVLIACNTMSCLINEKIRRAFDFNIFGIYPPVYRIKTEKCKALLLATTFTSNNYNKDIEAIPLEYLAKDIEKNIFNLKRIDLVKHFGKQKENYKKIILGCTHYLFLQDEIKNYFNAEVVSGNEDLIKNLKKSYFLEKKEEKNKKIKILDHFDHRNGKNYEVYIKTPKNRIKRVIFIGKYAKKYYNIFVSLIVNAQKN